MLMESFKEKLRIFADNPDAIMYGKGQVVLEVNNDLIEVNLIDKEGNIFVDENGVILSAEKWICTRLAKLTILADRILAYTHDEKNFIEVSGRHLPDLNLLSTDVEIKTSAVTSYLLDVLGERVPGTTSALYLTSDAGEGKTTIIEKLARIQAEKFKNKQADWLLLPVPLGGKPFARLDDVVIGTLVNKLRFSFLYYDSILELCKLGFLVLALDGFEEMFIVTPSGEAISALGNLLAQLNSSGRILIAARKAYFEFKSLKAQSQLFDTLSTCDVSFSKLMIDRWGLTQFVNYCNKIGLDSPNDLYHKLAVKLNSDTHPLLSRAVLVKRLCKVLKSSPDSNSVLDRLSLTRKDYFSEFIDVIIEREVVEKWIDRGGDVAKPLLPKEDHYILLAAIAEEMWLTATSSLTSSVIDMITELVCESLNKTPDVARQVVERTKQHSLICNALTSRAEFQFDHEEFRWFFLAYKIQQLIINDQPEEVRAIFRAASLPDFVHHIVAIGLKSTGHRIEDLCDFLGNAAAVESQLSFVKENTSSLLIHILNGSDNHNIKISHLFFKSDALKSKILKNIAFHNCIFQSISLQQASITEIKFEQCQIDLIELWDDSNIKNVQLEESLPKSIIIGEAEDLIFNPEVIERKLTQSGFVLPVNDSQQAFQYEDDPELLLVKRALRTFLRSTQVVDEVFVNKLGVDGKYFMSDIMPILLQHGILEELSFRGRGRHKIYKSKVRMIDLENAYTESDGNFNLFLQKASAHIW